MRYALRRQLKVANIEDAVATVHALILFRGYLIKEVELNKEPVELYRILKFEGLASSGGEAKAFIDSGAVRVNGEVETRRRRKIMGGDTIEYEGDTLLMVYGPE